MTIRPFQNADFETLRTIARDTFVATYAAHNEPERFQKYVDASFSTEQMQREVAHVASHFFLIFEQTKCLGYLKLNEVSAQTDVYDPQSLEIERIYVVENAKGKGIGKSLIQKAIEVAIAKNLKYVWLGVWEKNPAAIAFYERMGFQKFAEHIFQIEDDAQTDWLMRLDV
jgi:diamine N-acetyltransferase